MRPGWKLAASSAAPTVRSGRGICPYDRPPIVAAPDVGRTRPSSMRSVVVLPAPFGPRNPVTRPGATSKDRSSTARTGPNDLERCSTRIVPSVVMRPTVVF